MNIGIIGELGETAACEYLESKGYIINHTNFQTRFGEIDIICSNSAYLVFVEVKTRSKGYMVSGLSAVTRSKQQKIARAATQFLQSNPTKLQPRFDVIEVIVDSNNKTEIEHIANAFFVGGRNAYF